MILLVIVFSDVIVFGVKLIGLCCCCGVYLVIERVRLLSICCVDGIGVTREGVIRDDGIN